MKVSGRCFCGQITYTAEVNLEQVVICHCTDCQRHSGTAYGVIAGVVDEQFDLLTGELKFIDKIAASGAKRVLSICPNCGTRMYAKPADGPGYFGLRAGTIDQRDQLVPKMQLWCQSAQSWAIVDSIPQIDTQPSLKDLSETSQNT